MPRQVVLLRGINLGPSNRVAMPALREALAGAGFTGVRTHVQSGNVVLKTELSDGQLVNAVGEILADRFELVVPVIVRDAGELSEVIAGNPFPQAVAINPKRYQVTFFSAPLTDDVAARLQEVASSPSEFAPDVEALALAKSRRHAYGWHPEGIHLSKLARELTDAKLGVTATARNWTTVNTLLEMISADAA